MRMMGYVTRQEVRIDGIMDGVEDVLEAFSHSTNQYHSHRTLSGFSPNDVSILEEPAPAAAIAHNRP
jgi:hypothetical protein